MNRLKGSGSGAVSRRLLSGAFSRILGAGLVGALIFVVPTAVVAQVGQAAAEQNQAQPQPGQQGDWGQAGPPPDAQSGQIPPPSAEEDGQPSANDMQNAPPPAEPGEAAPPPPAGPGAPEYRYPQQGRAPYQSYPRQPGQYQPAPPSGPVTVAAGTVLRVRTDQPLDTKKVQPGNYFQATVAQSVYVGNVLAIPRGSVVTGQVVDVKKPGDLKGSAGFTLQLVSLNMGGRSYPLASDTWSMEGPGKGGYTAANTVGGAALGAVVGAIAGGGPGAAVGAVAGGSLGIGASAASSGPRGRIPPEAVLAFRLKQPATVQPVSFQEARDMEQNFAPPEGRYPPPRPGYGPYGYPPPVAYYYPGPYAYAYPYPYAFRYRYGYPYRRYYGYRRWR